MSRQRALKKRVDFRKGGFVNRKKFQDGSSVISTDRGFGERTTETASPVSIKTTKADSTVEADVAGVIADKTPTTAPEDVTSTTIQASQANVGQAQQQAPIQASRMDVVKAEDLATTQAAQGQVTREAQAEGPQLTERATAAQRDLIQETQAQATTPELQVSEDAFIKQIVGTETDVVKTTDAEKQSREATLGMPAPTRQEAQVINEFGFGSSKNRVIRGDAAKQAAANRLVAEHGITKDIADSILEDVGQLVTNIDGVPQETLGAVAELPTEALVSSQMESLLAGMEEGKVPAFARPAVAAIEQKLAERGLETSSVGRDALFNAIIQSALPIAQSNAQALQQRASQNLSNEQQAIIQDRQIAASFLSKNADFKQQMELANLSNDQQTRLANLSAQNQAGAQNLSAAQQTELSNLNSQLQSNLLQAKLSQQLGVAQLSVDQQTAIRNASMVANIDFTKFTTAQQTELANSKFMQTMTMADFNANQQAAMQNATALASMDMATADQNTKLAITNAKNFLTMDMANLTNDQQALMLDQQLQQQRLLSNQSAANASAQFNATSENQTNQFMANLAQNIETFNAAQLNALNQFNTSETNRVSALNEGNSLAAQKFNSELASKVRVFDEEIQFKTESWNAQNAQAVEQSNVEWRRKANTIDTAAQNAANQQVSKIAFNMSMAEQNFLWQQLRDEAAFNQQTNQNTKERAMQLLSSLYGNAELMDTNRGQTVAINLGNSLEDIIFGKQL